MLQNKDAENLLTVTDSEQKTPRNADFLADRPVTSVTDAQLIAALLRETVGLSLREAAADVGVSHQQIAEMRRASPPWWPLHAESRGTIERYLRRRGKLPKPLTRHLTESEVRAVRARAAELVRQSDKVDRWRLLEQVEALAALLRGEV